MSPLTQTIGSVGELFYNWPGIIRSSWTNRPAVIQSVNSWVNEDVKDVAARHSIQEFALARYDILRKQNTDKVRDLFVEEIQARISSAR